MGEIPPFYRAAEKLEPSKLSDQRELMGADIDVTTLELAVKGKKSLNIGSRITAGSVTRTTEGASTLNVTVLDDDLSLLRSGYLGGESLTVIPDQGTDLSSGLVFPQPVDTLLDGLWFRLSAVETTGRSHQLTFQDREVMLLRTYPLGGDPQTFKVFSEAHWERASVMVWLIEQVREIRGGIRWVCPLLTGNDRVYSKLNEPIDNSSLRQVLHQPGFPTHGPSGVTVKGPTHPATAQQLANIQAVLDAGNQMRVSRKLLVTAVMVITQESNAGSPASILLPGLSGATGLFQQIAKDGWPATGDATTDANAFYEHAIAADAADPNLSEAELAYKVQAPGPTPQGQTFQQYGQWQTEAENTVTVYTGELSGLDDTTGAAPSAFVPTMTGFVSGSGTFQRGSLNTAGTQNLIVRETNWAMLQRLASNVGWIVYCVSGTIYIEDQQHLFRKAVAFQFADGDPGVDQINSNINTGISKASAEVDARIALWKAPPGCVVSLQNHGPASGRWLVTEIERDLFSTTATITLGKAPRALPNAESSSPVQSTGTIEPSGTSTPQKGAVAPGAPQSSKIVAAAQKAIAESQNYEYREQRPMPSSLFGPPIPIIVDCSAFCTLVYKAAGMPDPNGPTYNYNGAGYTGTLAQFGTEVDVAQAGDLVFYGAGPVPYHVTVYMGNAQVATIGHPGDHPHLVGILDAGIGVGEQPSMVRTYAGYAG